MERDEGNVPKMKESVEKRKSMPLSLSLAFIVFWIGLGIGRGGSDFRFWYDQSRLTVILEWIFMFFYVLLTGRIVQMPGELWRKHRFAIMVGMSWIGVVSLSYAFSPYYGWDNSLAVMRISETLSHFLLFLFLRDFFVNYRPDPRRFYLSLIIPAVLLIGYFAASAVLSDFSKDSIHLPSLSWEGFSINGNIRRIGYQVETAFLLSLAFLPGGGCCRRRIFLFLMAIMFVFLVWLGGRASVLGVVSALAAYLVSAGNIRLLKISAWAGVMACVAVCVATMGGFFDLGHLSDSIKKTVQAGTIENFMSGRLHVWRMGWEHFRENWPLGSGPQSYFFYQGRGDMIIHPHNLFLQFLTEWGVVGTLLFLFLLLKAVHSGLKMRSWKNLDMPRCRSHFSAGLGIMALSVSGMFGGTYFFPQTSMYLALLYAVWTVPCDRKKYAEK
jgi:O-antigen ligase